MAYITKKMSLAMPATTLCLFLFISAVHSAPSNISAVYAFGDSILDSGNNNHLSTVARCNHVPYGMDFPGHIPTGRFSNGKVPTDIMVSEMGIKPVLPAYLDRGIKDRDLVSGVSFASGASGLDNLTSTESFSLSLEKQLECFEEGLKRMHRVVGDEWVQWTVEKAVYVVAAGSNDLLYNYYGLPLRTNMSVSEYHDLLLKNMEVFIRRLQSLGARKVAVMGLPPLGCLPVQVTIYKIKHFQSPSKNRVCVHNQNKDSQDYNTKLQTLLQHLQLTLPHGAKLAYVDIYTPLLDMVTRPSAYGFNKVLEGCCGSGLAEIGPLCNSHTPPCTNSSEYLFWDAAHPSEAAYTFLTKQFIRDVLPKLVQP